MQQLHNIILTIKKTTKGTIVYWNEDDLTFYIPKNRLPIPHPQKVYLTITAESQSEK